MTDSRRLEDEHSLKLLRALVRDVESVCPSAAHNLWEELRQWPEEGYGGHSILDFCMLDLPRVGKWFDSLLSGSPVSTCPVMLRGHLDPCSPSSVKGHYVPILDSIFGTGEHGTFLSAAQYCDWDLDPNLVFMARQFLYMFKKHVKACPDHAVRETCREFWQIEAALCAPRSFDTDLGFHVSSGSYTERLTQDDCQALRRMVSVMDNLALRLAPGSELDVNDLVPGHGPGAVSDLSSCGDKYTFPHFPRTISESMPAAYFCSPNWSFDHSATLSVRKAAAKLVAVPKTLEKPRLIASEPVVHQFLQQGLMKWIRGNMHPIHKVMINFTDQEPSRKAALAASKDGKCATVDLSSASDRLSLWVVESHFQCRPFLLDALLRTRSSHLFDPIWLKETRELKKFAPMGSAVTFPVQSIVYATAALAAAVVWEGKDLRPLKQRTLKGLAKRIRIFGDDIVIPKEYLPYLGLLFDYLQLKINSQKTHVNGGFRESCGMDAYRGNDVTPAYVSYLAPQRPGDTLVAFVEQSNNAHRKGLWHLAAEMIKGLPDEMLALLPISHEELGVAALYTYTQGTLSRRCRYNKDLHRGEVKGYSQVSRARVKKRNNQTDLLQYFLESPDPQTKWESGIRRGTRLKVKAVWVDSRSARTLRSLPRSL